MSINHRAVPPPSIPFRQESKCPVAKSTSDIAHHSLVQDYNIIQNWCDIFDLNHTNSHQRTLYSYRTYHRAFPGVPLKLPHAFKLNTVVRINEQSYVHRENPVFSLLLCLFISMLTH